MLSNLNTIAFRHAENIKNTAYPLKRLSIKMEKEKTQLIDALEFVEKRFIQGKIYHKSLKIRMGQSKRLKWFCNYF